MYTHEDNPLKAALGGFVDELVSSEQLDPDRIIAVGRAQRRRRRAKVSVASALAVLLVAGSAAYGLQGRGHALGAAGGTSSSATARVSRPATATASAALATPPAGTLKGTVVGAGSTDGVSWEVSAALDGYANGNSLPQFCLYVWTSNGAGDPTKCEGPVQPDPPDPAAPSHLATGDQVGLLPNSTLAYVAIYTLRVTTVDITAPGESAVLHPVTLATNVSVTGAVIPMTGASMKATGPDGSATTALSDEPR